MDPRKSEGRSGLTAGASFRAPRLPSVPTLRELFDGHDGRLVAKISHFFDDYEPHLARLRDADPRVLEIGISAGGSMELWRSYFGPRAAIHGIDLDPASVANAADGAVGHLGSQTDRAFLEGIVEEHGPFDLIIDDGSHMVDHQIETFEILYPIMAADGLYICEDSFSSYWPVYGGGLQRPGTFVEYAKGKVDELHAWWYGDEPVPEGGFAATTRSITFLSGAVLFDRVARDAPRYDMRAEGVSHSMSIEELHEAARSTVHREG